MTSRYTVLLEIDEDGPGCIAAVPALPGCLTQGATVPQTLERTKETKEGHIAALRELGAEIPEELVPSLQTYVEVETQAMTGG